MSGWRGGIPARIWAHNIMAGKASIDSAPEEYRALIKSHIDSANALIDFWAVRVISAAATIDQAPEACHGMVRTRIHTILKPMVLDVLEGVDQADRRARIARCPENMRAAVERAARREFERRWLANQQN